MHRGFRVTGLVRYLSPDGMHIATGFTLRTGTLMLNFSLPEQHVELYCIRGRNIFGVASFCYHIAEMLFKRDNNDFANSLFENLYIHARNGQTITFREFKKA
jgi:hypothetical protein